MKRCFFFFITFLLLKIDDRIKKIKTLTWLYKHACQISAKYNENWQSYQGLKLYKKAIFIGYVPWKTCFSEIPFLLFIIDNHIESKIIELNMTNQHTKLNKKWKKWSYKGLKS